MYNNSFFKKILIVTSVLFLYSCDKDYNSIGDGLFGENHFDLNKDISEVVAYNQKIGPIESNNLPINALGIYSNPAFGTTTANFATQLNLSSLSPEIGANPVIESVILTIPYFIDALETKQLSDGTNTYKLDSIYGPTSGAKIKLSVYESGYYMRDLDPIGGFQEKQKFYTDQNADFNNVKIGSRLNDDSNLEENDEFFFDPRGYFESVTDPKTNVITRTQKAPAMRLNLNMNFFKTKIIDAANSGKLSSNDAFKDYFRGLYFKVEKSGANPTAMAMLDFRAGNIEIKFKEDKSTTANGTTTVTRVDNSITLKLLGNTVSLLEQTNTKAAYANATNPANINTTLGDEKLYLKGGEGSLAIIELFGSADVLTYNKSTGLITNGGNGIPDKLDIIRKEGWLINEANLVFHVDESDPVEFQPERVYLYDFNNSRPILDYYMEGSSSTSSKKGRSVFGGILNKTVVGDKTYKIRITNQIRQLVKNVDSTNVKFGLVVTEDIETVASNKLRTSNSKISQAPRASVMNPLGTVLFGNNILSNDPNSNYDKRLRLEIYYTTSK